MWAWNGMLICKLFLPSCLPHSCEAICVPVISSTLAAASFLKEEHGQAHHKSQEPPATLMQSSNIWRISYF